MAKKKAIKKEVKADIPSPSVDNDYQSEDDHRTLKRASEILGDPDRMKKAHKHHKKEKKSMRSVADLIEHRNKMALEPDEDDGE